MTRAAAQEGFSRVTTTTTRQISAVSCAATVRPKRRARTFYPKRTPSILLRSRPALLGLSPPGGPGSSCGLDAKVCFLYVECVNEYFPCYKRNNSFLQPRVLAPFPPKVRYQTMRSPGIKTVGDEKSKTWRVQQHIFTTNFFITIC